MGVATYTNEKLYGHLQEAIDELDDALAENGISVLTETSVNLDLPASTTRIAYTGTTPTLPADLKEVLKVDEKTDGSPDHTFRPVTPCLVLPSRSAESFLGDYAWEESELKFIGASLAVDIRLRYIKGFPDLTIPVDKTQTIPFNRALPFLAGKTAALVAANVMKDFDRAQILHEQAQNHLARALNRNVRTQQATPVRRRGWRRRHRGRYLL